MRAAIYARVSTTNGQSPEMQLSDLREYASRRGWEVLRSTLTRECREPKSFGPN